MMNLFNRRGMILVSTYLILSLLGTFSLSVFLKNLSAHHTSQRTIHRIVAFHEAESGVDQAIVQLRTNLAYAGQGYTALGGGGYDMQVTSTDPANPLLRQIIANGHAPNNLPTASAYERRQVVVHVTFTPSSPTFAVFSDTSIQMSGNAGTDSYDSRLGPYDSRSAANNGDLGTNTTRAGFVMMSGNVRIGGDAVVGAGGNPSQVIRTSGNVQIVGSQTAASTPTALDPVVVPSNLVNLGSLRISGNDVVALGGGNYLYSSISITGNGRLNMTGPATIYVSGSVSIAGNGVSTSQNLPPNLTLNVAGAHTVQFTGNANFFGKVYAPDSAMHLTGNGSIFGSLAVDSLQQSGNAKVHYDEALGEPVGGTANKSTLRAWVEN